MSWEPPQVSKKNKHCEIHSKDNIVHEKVEFRATRRGLLNTFKRESGGGAIKITFFLVRGNTIGSSSTTFQILIDSVSS
jgi:hypothetical protein